MRRCIFVLAGAVSLCALAAHANAATIHLSTHSSDETPPSFFSATLEFSVTGSQMTLAVTNDTAVPFDYRITEVFFNGGSNVTGLSLIGAPANWSLLTGAQAPGFGVFEYSVRFNGNPPQAINAGATAFFTFNVTGAGFVAEDFITNFSTIPPGQMTAIAAAKFQDGPDNDSGTGAYVPAPGAAAPLLGLLAIASRRRR